MTDRGARTTARHESETVSGCLTPPRHGCFNGYLIYSSRASPGSTAFSA